MFCIFAAYNGLDLKRDISVTKERKIWFGIQMAIIVFTMQLLFRDFLGKGTIWL